MLPVTVPSLHSRIYPLVRKFVCTAVCTVCHLYLNLYAGSGPFHRVARQLKKIRWVRPSFKGTNQLPASADLQDAAP